MSSVLDRDDAATRLAPAEASELAALLKGRVSWRGVRALAHELGVSEETIHRAIRRARMQPRTVARLRAALAARAVGGVLVGATKGPAS